MLRKLIVPVVALSWLAACANDPTPASPPPPAAPAPTVSYMVFFDWASAKLTDQGVSTIQEAATVFKSKQGAKISAAGFTDTSGNAEANVALSKRRVDAVKAELVKDGVPADAIATTANGETQLLVNTGDDVKDQRNRRVIVIIQ
jgi:outer membrane protein OmpA-like peptidoglycan-associated protein